MERSKKKFIKKTVGFSQMKTTSLYIMLGDRSRTLYRKRDGKLEKMEAGKWINVKVTTQTLMEGFREY